MSTVGLQALPLDVIDPQTLIGGAVGVLVALAGVELGVGFLRRAVATADDDGVPHE